MQWLLLKSMGKLGDVASIEEPAVSKFRWDAVPSSQCWCSSRALKPSACKCVSGHWLVIFIVELREKQKHFS